MQNAYRASAAW